MSFETYNQRLPETFNPEKTSETPTAGSSSEITTDNGKRFADITEIHEHQLLGSNVETMPTSQYCPPPKQKSKRQISRHGAYAVLIRRLIDSARGVHVLRRAEVCIQSETLCETSREMVKDAYDSVDIKSTPIVIQGPSYELFFKRKGLEAFVSDTSKPQTIRDEVGLLHTFIKNDKTIVQNIKAYDALISQGKISTNTLWTLFPPGELLIRNDGECPECWICCDVKQEFKTCSWLIYGVRLDFDGRRLDMKKVCYPIYVGGVSRGTLEISQLPLIPLHYYPKEAEVRKLLIKRGHDFQNIMRADLAYRNYRGPLWSQKNLHSHPELRISGRVVVDYKAYLDKNLEMAPDLVPQKRNKNYKALDQNSTQPANSDHVYDPDCSCTTCTSPHSYQANSSTVESHFKTLLQDVDEQYSVIRNMEDLLLLASARMTGYNLRENKWGWLLIDSLEDIGFSRRAFDSLQMDVRQKKLIEALVKGHQSNEFNDFNDFIYGKGKGLMMLLHGTPGIGKTLTAESIAEQVKSPLYNITGGELSVDVSRVEAKLKDIFALAKRWKAIVLLDEADVLMMKRELKELERNSIVTMQLRMIGRFEGILFLTANRFEGWDEAFKVGLILRFDCQSLMSASAEQSGKTSSRTTPVPWKRHSGQKTPSSALEN
ncbi:uncharacterized protein DFL_009402 [Arthrobotrys flagrans]|uniref:AAA+ ATPase domain-containing protein n=1 Tax=Arthrobotrys flagrans TaxID=97331 RepID=A0A436ZRV5_ARTFL|nr:hypothetical protein DFL_009402 [Arthrobotrys flagrans]